MFDLWSLPGADTAVQRHSHRGFAPVRETVTMAGGEKQNCLPMVTTAKSIQAIADLILAELRKHPQCNAVSQIKIIRPVAKNWDVSIRGARKKYPPECRKIIRMAVQ